MREAVDDITKDWATYQRPAIEFHLRTAAAVRRSIPRHDAVLVERLRSDPVLQRRFWLP
jgi:hypothetical protein